MTRAVKGSQVLSVLHELKERVKRRAKFRDDSLTLTMRQMIDMIAVLEREEVARLHAPQVTSPKVSAYSTYTFAWSGYDLPVQTHTSPTLRLPHDHPVPLGTITNMYEADNGLVIEILFKSKAARDKAIAIERAIGRMFMGEWPEWDDDDPQ